jgi:hypothetical protein
MKEAILSKESSSRDQRKILGSHGLILFNLLFHADMQMFTIRMLILRSDSRFKYQTTGMRYRTRHTDVWFEHKEENLNPQLNLDIAGPNDCREQPDNRDNCY